MTRTGASVVAACERFCRSGPRKSWGDASRPWTAYGGGGYWIRPGQHNRNGAYAGVVLQWSLTDHLAFGAEVFHQTPQKVGGHGATGIDDQLAQLALLFQSQWRRPPTPEELDRMVENQVEQEILYREALAMGLDKDDEIVKRRMAQKMQFLAEDVAAAHEPTTEELESWFEKNSASFAQPPRLSFRHLYFSPDHRGAHAGTMRRRCSSRLPANPRT